MTTFTLYIFQSLIDSTFYIGQTDNLENRIIDHLQRRVKSTKFRCPLALVHTEVFKTRNEARYREWKLKHSAWQRTKLFNKIKVK